MREIWLFSINRTKSRQQNYKESILFSRMLVFLGRGTDIMLQKYIHLRHYRRRCVCAKSSADQSKIPVPLPLCLIPSTICLSLPPSVPVSLVVRTGVWYWERQCSWYFLSVMSQFSTESKVGAMETGVRGHSRRQHAGVTSGNKDGAVTDSNSTSAPFQCPDIRM